MKKITILLIIVGLVQFLIADVFITELADPNNAAGARFVELYNNGASAVDLNTGWQLQRATNANTYWQTAKDLTGTISAGGFYIVCANQTTFTSTYGFAADQDLGTGGPADSNGDDQIRLLSTGSVVEDMFGVLGEDGSGTNHEFENGRAERKATVTTGNTTYTFSEWNIWNDTGSAGTTNLPQNAPDDFDPGSWIGTGGGNNFPVVTDITTDPLNPVSTDAVDVSADITDSDGTITSAKLMWGTDGSTFPNTISMSTSRAIYTTVSTIPAQTQGTTVYYKIEAVDDEPDTTTTGAYSYQIPYEILIYDIQGQTSASPYDGDEVITNGVVTAIYDNSYVIQDSASAWNGIWVNNEGAPAELAIGDDVNIRGDVTEYNYWSDENNTFIENAVVNINSSGNSLPGPIVISTANVPTEAYEGVFIKVENALCTNTNLGYGAWEVDDGSGAARVDDLAYAFTPTLGTPYNVTGPIGYSHGDFNIEPRDSIDVAELGDTNPPEISDIVAPNNSTVLVTFSEYVDKTTSENTANYSIVSRLVTVDNAVRNDPDSTKVTLTVSGMAEGDYTLTVINVEDLHGNAMTSESMNFSYTAPPETGDVVINEIGEPYEMPNTYYDSYIELYNNTENDIDISNWIIHSIQAKGKATSSFTFPEGTVIQADSFIIATRDRDYFLADYGTYVDNSIVPIASATTGNGVYIKNGYYFSLETDIGTTLESTSSTIYWNSEVYERTNPDSAANNDDNWYLTYQSEPVQGTPGHVNSEAPAPTPYTIYQLQSEDHSGEMVQTSGIVTGVFSGKYTIQDGTGAYRGIWVIDSGVSLADSITVTGIVSESSGLTIITADVTTINSSGNPLPAAEVLSTGLAGSEEYEGVLIQTTGECTGIGSYGEWDINDGSGTVVIDDLGYAFTPTIGNTYEVTGPLYYSYGNFKIEPRDENDIETQLPAPTNVVITIADNKVTITWDAVDGAASYNVYSSDNPYDGFDEDDSGAFDGTSWTASANDKKFYRVTAE